MDTAFGRFDDHVVNEKFVKKVMDKNNRDLRATEESLITMRTHFAEMLLEVTAQNDPLADARRFQLLDMFEEFQIKVMKTDSHLMDAVLAAGKGRKSRRHQRVNLLAGLDKLNYNFLDKPAKWRLSSISTQSCVAYFKANSSQSFLKSVSFMNVKI